MSFELDPIYHTVSMLKVLMQQEHWNSAYELCQKILEKNPDHAEVYSSMELIRSHLNPIQFRSFENIEEKKRKVKKLWMLFEKVTERKRK